MKTFSKRIKLNIPTKLLKFQKEILKTEKSFHDKSDLSLTNNHKKDDECDNDKINFENINYIEKNIFNKKSFKTKNSNSSSLISKFNKATNKKSYYPLLLDKDNLFKNKLIRNLNKTKNMQISIFEQEISMKNLLTTKKNKYMENKYQVIKDKNDTINNKNRILNIIRTQTKSNFNNKYRLMFKSSNKKKRNVIQNYFSLIKRDMHYDYEPINSTSRKLYNIKINGFRELSFRQKQKKKIKKDILENLEHSKISEKKRRMIFIPIINPNKKENEYVKTNF